MDKENEVLDERRESRRRRRKRNQTLSYLFLILFFVLIIGGGVFGANCIWHFWGYEKPEPVQPELPIEEVQDPIIIDEPEQLPVEEPIDPEVALMEEMIQSYIGQMTLQEKVAQLFIVTPEQITGVNKVTVAGNTTQKAFEKYTVGGVIYFSRNIVTYEKFQTMIAKTKEFSKYPLFVGIDEEGGTVSRIAGTVSDVSKTDDMGTIGATGDANNATTAYTTIAAYLTDLGINVDFAPVADLDTDLNDLFDKRAFGSDPVLVSDYIRNSVLALENNGISACLKHFPGHGATDEDSEVGMAVTNRTLDEMRASEFLPFIAGIDAGADFIMVGHISVPGITETNIPASVSKDVITAILREELGYDGIVITDAMNMPSITDYYLSGEAAVMAIQAGADMILMPEDFEEAYQAILDAITAGTITEDRINESLHRIYKVKCEDTIVTSIDDMME